MTRGPGQGLLGADGGPLMAMRSEEGSGGPALKVREPAYPPAGAPHGASAHPQDGAAGIPQGPHPLSLSGNNQKPPAHGPCQRF